MRDDFCAFVLSNGRPDRVKTVNTIRAAGYSGKVFVVIDDEDKTADGYRDRFGDAVLTFSKAAVAATIDEGDNFNDRRAIIYARNACFNLAAKVGCRYFIQLDDDYTGLYYRYDAAGRYGVWRIGRTFDALIDRLIEFFEATPALSVAISQGGDHIGGDDRGDPIRLRRKAMNTFICSTDRPFKFFGRINEDVNTYTCAQRRGALFFTVMQAQVNQLATQSNAGGMTELYLDTGTYIKSFYSVMYAPSCVKICTLGDPRSPHQRLHHAINWNAAAPRILRDIHRKATQTNSPDTAPGSETGD